MLASSPEVSVITPAFNRSAYLVMAVDSVLAQTFDKWELIVVDDGSTDKTREVLAPYLSDPRIRYYYQSNKGQSAARNLGISVARGRYIGFLDSDDIWLPDKLALQVAVFERFPDIGVVHGDEITIDAQGRPISSHNMARYSGSVTAQLLADNFVSMTTALARKDCFDVLGGFDEADRIAEDYELWLRLSTRYQFHYEPGHVTLYRSMPDQLSTNKIARYAANERILRNFFHHFPDAVTPAQRRWGMSRFYTRKARFFASIGERMIAIRSILKALLLNPIDGRVWRGVFRVVFPDRSNGVSQTSSDAS